jgi:hypothetical protein
VECVARRHLASIRGTDASYRPRFGQHPLLSTSELVKRNSSDQKPSTAAAGGAIPGASMVHVGTHVHGRLAKTDHEREDKLVQATNVGLVT